MVNAPLVPALLGLSALLAVISGYASANALTAAPEPLSSAPADPTPAPDRFVTVARDVRRCAPPLCGGYWVQGMNVNAEREYASDLDFSASGLDEATIARVREAPAVDLVLRGRLGPLDPMSPFQTRRFQVVEAYRGLPPPVRSSEEDRFYQVKQRSLHLDCPRSPCLNGFAEKLTTEERFALANDLSLNLHEEGSSFHLDRAWLLSRITERGAIVAGKLERAPGSTQAYVLSANQIYLRLPESIGPCPQQPEPQCGERERKTYLADRTKDRCLVFDRCDPLPAPMGHGPALSCPSGYTLKAWSVAGAYWARWVCDPKFTEDEQRAP